MRPDLTRYQKNREKEESWGRQQQQQQAPIFGKTRLSQVQRAAMQKEGDYKALQAEIASVAVELFQRRYTGRKRGKRRKKIELAT